MTFLEIIHKKNWNEEIFNTSINNYIDNILKCEKINQQYKNFIYKSIENNFVHLDIFYSFLDLHPEINETNFFKLKPEYINEQEWKSVLYNIYIKKQLENTNYIIPNKKCKFCKQQSVVALGEIQRRSADEPADNKYRCKQCQKEWFE